MVDSLDCVEVGSGHETGMSGTVGMAEETGAVERMGGGGGAVVECMMPGVGITLLTPMVLFTPKELLEGTPVLARGGMFLLFGLEAGWVWSLTVSIVCMDGTWGCAGMCCAGGVGRKLLVLVVKAPEEPVLTGAFACTVEVATFGTTPACDDW